MWNEPTKERLAKIPKLYETEDIPLQDKDIYLHFFISGCDWYIAEFNKGKVHPRQYGHFPRILARHVRERGDLKLEEAIKKMTSMIAARIGSQDRGIISENKFADIVIFNPVTIQDKATWDNPHQYPEGIDYVFVNGSWRIGGPTPTATPDTPGSVEIGRDGADRGNYFKGSIDYVAIFNSVLSNTKIQAHAIGGID